MRGHLLSSPCWTAFPLRRMGKSTTYRYRLETPGVTCGRGVFSTKGSKPDIPHYCNDYEICCCCSHYRVTQSDIGHSGSKNTGVNGLDLWIFDQVLIIVSR